MQMLPGFSKWDVTDYLKTDEDIILFLEACFDEGGDDAAFIAAALGEVARARGRRARACIARCPNRAIRVSAPC